MKERIESLIFDVIDQYNVPGFAIGVVKDGQVIFEQGFGTISLGSGRPVTRRTMFQLCSIAKGFTATAIMQLAEAGKIDPDSSVTTYLPYFYVNDERVGQITVRHLLTHTSGLPSGFEWKERIRSFRDTPPAFDDNALERYVRNLTNVSLSSTPGQTFNYSDMAYNILGDVIAKTTGQSFESYINEYILAPLGMKDSTFLLQEVNQDLLAMPHVRNETADVAISDVFPYTRHHAPSCNLYSNVTDMARWASMNLNRGVLGGVRILTESAHTLVWTPYAKTDWGDRLYSYGFGWFVGNDRERTLIRHPGGDIGFHAELLMVPEDSLSIVALGNYMNDLADPWYASDVALAVTNIVLDEVR